MSKNVPDKDIAFHQSLQKGHRFFARKNFALAKKEFVAALSIRADEELQEKLRICTEEIARQGRKEAIKRGRKLEKKEKYVAALQCFEKAAAQETEAWLGAKIAELRKRLALSEASTRVAGAEGSDDLETRLTAYDQAIAIKPTDALLQKKVECLVKLGRFAEATSVYGTHPPAADPARYHLGYAYAKVGRYLDALQQWAGLPHKDRRLWAQVEHLLPFVCRELKAEPRGYAIPYEFLQAVPEAEKSLLLNNYGRYFKFKYLEELWAQEEYEKMLMLLSPAQEAMSLPLLALSAKVYFKLAERDIQHLERAISFWLTAVYNDPIIESLHIKRLLGESLDSQAIRARLLQSMEALVEGYARQGLLSARLRALWKMEARIIHHVSTLSLTACPLEVFPCTPTFADEFSLAGQIGQCLEERRKTVEDHTEGSIEASTYFSEGGRSLMLMELGEVDEALSLIPKDPQNEIETYCRQRVLLGYGIQQARAGEKQLKKYFTEVLPLLERYPRYADELIELVYAEEEVKSYLGLAEVMELLSEHLQTPRFQEATAHAMSIKAIELLNSKVTPAVAQKLLEKALHIYPDSHLAQSTLASVKTRMSLGELGKAFKRQNLSKAVNLINRDRDPKLIEYFFETMERWFETVMKWEPEQQLASLREFYESCSLVDNAHPLTLEIGAELRRLEDK